MARPPKVGLSYFPLDTDFFDDIKVKRFMRAQGTQGLTVLVALLCMIYRDKGYYLEWDDDIAFLLVDRNFCGSDSGVLEAVTAAVKVGLFDANMWEQCKVLTSRGIQRRFAEVTSRRKNSRNRDGRFALISELMPTETPLNGITDSNNPTEREFLQQKPHLNGITDSDNPQKESKRKVNKKSCSSSENDKKSDDDFAEIANLFSDNIHPVSGEIEKDMLIDYCNEYGKNWVLEAIREAALRHGRSVKYVGGILAQWKERGFKTTLASKGGTKNDGAGRSTRKDKGEALSEFEQAELRQQQNRPWNLPPDGRRAGA